MPNCKEVRLSIGKMLPKTYDQIFPDLGPNQIAGHSGHTDNYAHAVNLV